MARRGEIKGRRKGGARDPSKRPVRFRRYDQIFLIVCEDENTEPSYFRRYLALVPEETLYLECIGTGKDPLGVVESAIKEARKLSEKAKKEVDFVWVVFDKDDADLNDNRIKRFQTAFALSKENSIRLAYSNEAFELWLLLHFIELDPRIALPRKKIYSLLEREICKFDEEFQYLHGDIAILEKVDTLGSEEDAIKRAKLLNDYFSKTAPILANPSTKVAELVQELNDWVRYYNWEAQ